jgi:hypothetical protein
MKPRSCLPAGSAGMILAAAIAVACGASAAAAGEIGYDPPETITARADLVVIAKQTGKMPESVRPKDGALIAELFVSDFEVRQVFKGAVKGKTVRVRSNRYYDGGGFRNGFALDKEETAVLQLRAPAPGESEWLILPHCPAKYALKPEEARKWLRTTPDIRRRPSNAPGG